MGREANENTDHGRKLLPAETAQKIADWQT